MKHVFFPGRHVIRTLYRFRLLALAAILATAGACTSLSKPEGWTAPVSDNGTLYVSLDHGTLSAYKTGDPPQQLWTFPANKDDKQPLVVDGGNNLATPKQEQITFEGFYGNPAFNADTLYVTGYSGHVIALNRADGHARWVAELPGRVVGGALLTNDAVYVGTTDGELYRFNPQTGAVDWRVSAAENIQSTPVMVDNQIVVPTMEGDVSAFDAQGNRLWSAKVADGALAADPAVAGTHLYLGSADKRMYAVDASAASKGTVIWRSAPADNWFWTGILLDNGTIYAGSLGGTVYAYPTEGSGEVAPLWSQKVGDLIRARPVLSNGVLVVGVQDGRLVGLQPGNNGTPAWAEQATDPAAPGTPRGDLFADLTVTTDGVVASTETGRDNGSIYLLDVVGQRVREVRLKQ